MYTYIYMEYIYNVQYTIYIHIYVYVSVYICIYIIRGIGSQFWRLRSPDPGKPVVLSLKAECRRWKTGREQEFFLTQPFVLFRPSVIG